MEKKRFPLCRDGTWEQTGLPLHSLLTPFSTFSYLVEVHRSTRIHTTSTQWPLKDSKAVRISQLWYIITGVPSRSMSEMIKLDFNWPLLVIFSLVRFQLFAIETSCQKALLCPIKAQKPPNTQRCCNKQANYGAAWTSKKHPAFAHNDIHKDSMCFASTGWSSSRFACISVTFHRCTKPLKKLQLLKKLHLTFSFFFCLCCVWREVVQIFLLYQSQTENTLFADITPN